MVWLHPVAWVGLAAIAAPVLIHLLVHKRAAPLLFPTLRFVVPTRLAAMRRQFLDDVPLLLVRAAILAAATAATAAPFVTTALRRNSWNAHAVRAVVVDSDSLLSQAQREAGAAFRGTVIKAPTISEGLKRAVAWVKDAPPAKREVIAISAFPISSMNASDVTAIPVEIGVRLVRVGSLPAATSSDARPTLGLDANPSRARLHQRSVALDAGETRVVDRAAADVALPIEVDARAADQPAIDAAVGAVLSEGVAAPASNRAARLVLVGAPRYVDAVGSAEPIRQPWIADTVAAIAHDAEFARAARSAAAFLTDSRFTRSPWQPLGDGPQPVAAAAVSGERLLIISAAPARHVATLLLIRAVLNGLAPREPPSRGEVLAIPDAVLRRWERAPASVGIPDLRRLDDDDRRWFWAAALALLAVEASMRRTRRASEDVARVA